MNREDKKIMKALRSASVPVPPDDLLAKILSQNGLEVPRSPGRKVRWAIAGCAAAAAMVAVLWSAAPRTRLDKWGPLVAARQHELSPSAAPVIKRAAPKISDRRPAQTVKAPRVLTGREPGIRIQPQTPKTYIASSSQAEPAMSSMSPVKIGRTGPGSSGSAAASMWTQNDRGVWVFVEINQKEVNGQSVSVVKQTESDCKPQRLLVSSSSDLETNGERDE